MVASCWLPWLFLFCSVFLAVPATSLLSLPSGPPRISEKLSRPVSHRLFTKCHQTFPTVRSHDYYIHVFKFSNHLHTPACHYLNSLSYSPEFFPFRLPSHAWLKPVNFLNSDWWSAFSSTFSVFCLHTQIQFPCPQWQMVLKVELCAAFSELKPPASRNNTMESN